jgi:hypothetical protein
MGFGVDYDSIWLRKAEIIKPWSGPTGHEGWSSRGDLELTYRTHFVGFCGKIYGCVVLKKPATTWEKGKEKICWNIDEVDEFVNKNYKKKQIDYYLGKDRGWGWRSYYLRMSAKRGSFVQFWERVREVHDKKEKLFIDHNSPVFIDNKINACLKDLEFFRVVDPYTAFQEIQMFFGKLRSPERPIPEISNSDMIEAKGFDLKSSFRKEPGKKKRKRKK